jgi:hypothetical protein
VGNPIPLNPVSRGTHTLDLNLSTQSTGIGKVIVLHIQQGTLTLSPTFHSQTAPQPENTEPAKVKWTDIHLFHPVSPPGALDPISIIQRDFIARLTISDEKGGMIYIVLKKVG